MPPESGRVRGVAAGEGAVYIYRGSTVYLYTV